MNCESSSCCVWYFLVYTGQGIELLNQFVTTETNKTAAVVKQSGRHVGHGQSVWTDSFYNLACLAWFMKSKKMDCVETLHADKKNVPPEE
jgi:hypothetical protein